jgi:hypothetical protein
MMSFVDTSAEGAEEDNQTESHTSSTSGFEWNDDVDQLLANWCDQSKCFVWMHAESYSVCERRSKQFMIGINCLTAASGLSNVITGATITNGIPLSWIFGSISILASTLNILQDKLGFQQNSAIHKKLEHSWAYLSTKLEGILVLPYSARQDCKTFLQTIKSDINQAKLEGSSLLSKEIRIACYEKFKGVVGFDIPDICGQMEHTRIFFQKGSASVLPAKDSPAEPLLEKE